MLPPLLTTRPRPQTLLLTGGQLATGALELVNRL